MPDLDLTNFNSIERLHELICVDLNYDRESDRISRKDWNQAASQALAEDPIIFASAGFEKGFRIIYARLSQPTRPESPSLSLTAERAVINELLEQHRYALFVFSNYAQDQWHFVNVKLITQKGSSEKKELQKKHIFRRITLAPPYTNLHTANERLQLLNVESISGRDMFGLAPLAIQIRHDEAFDVEAVTRKFFQEYSAIFKEAETSIAGIQGDARRLFTQKLFNRLMFIVFLERKGWLSFKGSYEYLNALWKEHLKQKQNDPARNFYRHRLYYLFFTALNSPNEVNIMGASGGLANNLDSLVGKVPYLNGGLFEPEADDQNENIFVPDEIMDRAIKGLFYRFNFTVIESTPLDVEVAVDPEMLGRIFEELVTGRHESGSYYTPKSIVSFMGREALKGYLKTTCPLETESALTKFVNDQDTSELQDPECIFNALWIVRICDPACGSGAYLLGMLQELLGLRESLFAKHKLGSKRIYERKLEIIQKNLFGVDIDPFAVNIARLRLWLSLVVDYEETNIYNLPALPNLDFKIEEGDSLITPDPTGGQQPSFHQVPILEFRELKEQFLSSHISHEKKALKQQIEKLSKNIRGWTYTTLEDEQKNRFDWAIDFADVFADGGFDIVVANPPYVRQELIKNQKPALKQVYGDLFSGTADLYVSFYLRGLQLLKPGGILAYISSNKWLRAGYGEKLRKHLSQTMTIETLVDFGDLPVFGAIAYPCVIILRDEPPSDTHTFNALTVTDMATVQRVGEAVLEESWQQPQASLSAKSWALTRPEVLALMTKLRSSGKTLGKYVDDNFYRGIVTGYNEAFVIDETTRELLISQDPKSAEIIKPYLRGRDIKRWGAEWANLYLIFTRRGIEIEKYPAILSYLERFKNRLIPGIKGGRKPGTYAWYEIQDNIAYYREFEKPKIVYQEIATYQAFAYIEGSFYTNNKCFIIPTDDLYLLGLLNSAVVWFFLGQIASLLQGGAYAMQSPYISQIPIPDVSPQLRGNIEEVVSHILSVQGEGTDIQQFEARLNQLVYKAYKLSPEEINLIEIQPQMIPEIQAAYPDQWLVIEITERDAETNQPIKGRLRAVAEDGDAAWVEAAQYKDSQLYVFYNSADLLPEGELE